MADKGKGKKPEAAIVQQPVGQFGKAPAGYEELISTLKEQIRSAQIRAGLAANRELVLLYWEIGRQILARQQQEGWGAKVIDHLSRDLSLEFPEMKGFSPRNLKYMRAFAEAVADRQFVQEVLAQISWYHNITLLDKIKDPAELEWYIRQTMPKNLKKELPSIEELETSLKEPGNGG